METSENLESILREVEQHVSAAGWDQPTRLFALVSTKELMASDPDLANELGLSADQPLTSIEQEVSGEQDLEELLGTIAWPDEVLGAVLSIERIILPPDAESSLPKDNESELVEVAATHPDRRDVRMVSAVLRDGTNLNALRYRDHDEPDSVAIAPNLIERLNDSLLATFES
ncbi:MAG: hypothetical protein RLZZ571_1151 [Actinomycetota bacterium]|jgi:hypothetical protein